MKSREEYIASIYAKRDSKIKERKKTISVLTSALCLTVCFIAVFAFVPKTFGQKSTASDKTTNKHDNLTLAVHYPILKTTETAEELLSSGEKYLANYNQNIEAMTDTDGATKQMNDSEIKGTLKNEYGSSDEKLQTEIAIETTFHANFGYIGEPFDPNSISKPSFGGYPALAPADPPEDYVTGVSEPYYEKDDLTKSTTEGKTKSSEEAITQARKYLSEEDASEIIDEKTQVTVTRTASGKTTYTVYFYTKHKSFTIDVDAVTLRIIGCKEKNLVSGSESYISPPWFPETTAALPEYKPQ